MNIPLHLAWQVLLCALLGGLFWLACAGIGLQILPRPQEFAAGGEPEAASWRQPGVAACVGLGALLLIGGFGVVLLVPWWLYVVPFLVVGLVLAVREIIGLDLAHKVPRAVLVVGAIAIVGVGVVAIVESLVGLRIPLNPCDDLRAYLPMAKRLLATSGLDEPWSVRRAESLGGFDLVRALPVAIFGNNGVGIADTAIAGIFLAGMFVANGLRTTWTRVLGVALILAVPLVWVPRVNTTGVLLGSPLLVAVLAATLELRASLRAGRRRDAARWAAADGLVAAALFSVRPSLGLAGALIVGLGTVAATRTLVADRARILGVGAASTLIAVGPWSFDMWRTVGTPLYPLFPGNINSPALQGAPVGGLSNRLHGAFDLSRAGPYLWVALGVWVVAIVGRRVLTDAPMLALGAVATIIVTVAFALNTPLLAASTFARYVAPMSEALAVFLVCETLRHADANTRRDLARRRDRRWPALAIAAAVVLTAFAYSTVGLQWNLLRSGGRMVVDAVEDPRPGVTVESAGLRAAYAQAMAGVDGSRTITSADRPYLLDYGRDDVKNLDAPGFMTPDSRFPFFAGPGAMIAKLRGAGFDTLLATDPTSDVCLDLGRMKAGANGHGASRGVYARFLDWDEDLEKIAAEAPASVQRFGTLLRIDLRVAQQTFSP